MTSLKVLIAWSTKPDSQLFTLGQYNWARHFHAFNRNCSQACWAGWETAPPRSLIIREQFAFKPVIIFWNKIKQGIQTKIRFLFCFWFYKLRFFELLVFPQRNSPLPLYWRRNAGLITRDSGVQRKGHLNSCYGYSSIYTESPLKQHPFAIPYTHPTALNKK